MDSEFIRQRAAHCRFLAEMADPFIRRRLLALASKYEADLVRQRPQTTINLTAQQIATPRN
jgi:hypothetical protein